MWPEARQRVAQPPLHLPHVASSLRCTATISRPCIRGFPDEAPHRDDDLDPSSWPAVWRDNPMPLAGPPRRQRRWAPACFQFCANSWVVWIIWFHPLLMTEKSIILLPVCCLV